MDRHFPCLDSTAWFGPRLRPGLERQHVLVGLRTVPCILGKIKRADQERARKLPHGGSHFRPKCSHGSLALLKKKKKETVRNLRITVFKCDLGATNIFSTQVLVFIFSSFCGMIVRG